LAAPVVTGPKALAASSPIETLDRDSDRTLDLEEVKNAASAEYDQLDKDTTARWIARKPGLASIERNFPPPTRIMTAP